MSQESQPVSPPFWQCLLFGGLAGGMAWGIRGQYGHETGAMLAGLLVGLSLTLLLCPRANSLAVARAVAWCTVGIGIGGTETYAQTVGLTHNPPVIGNWAALQWGMLGLAVKGAVWIGFGGAFLGMGLGGVRYRCWEMLLVMAGLIGLNFLGIWLLNEPYDPGRKLLPDIYFSADWYWEPDAGPELKPRRETWGGLTLALAGLILYAGAVRRDWLGWRMGLWGILGGAIGFPLGQCVQAFHAWNQDGLFQNGFLVRVDRVTNWWNFMETTFGAVMGAVLGLGLWLNRHRIAVGTTEPPASITPEDEGLLIGGHIFLLLCAEFGIVRELSWIYAPGLFLALIPIVMISGGRVWPYWLMFPIAIIPIAGKTLRNLGYENHIVDIGRGWWVYVILPVALMVIAARHFATPARQGQPASTFLRPGLLLATWVTFGLNLAFFQFPWPWSEWTKRTPNNLVFTACALGLTVLAVWVNRKQPHG